MRAAALEARSFDSRSRLEQDSTWFRRRLEFSRDLDFDRSRSVLLRRRSKVIFRPFLLRTDGFALRIGDGREQRLPASRNRRAKCHGFPDRSQ